MYSYVICMSLVCSRMLLVCHSYILVCDSYVNRMYLYVIGMSLVSGFPMNFCVPLYDSFLATLWGSSQMQNIWHTSFLLVLQNVLRETETAVTRLLGREFLLKSRQISWWIYYGVYFKQNCTYQLIKNVAKNKYLSYVTLLKVNIIIQ